MAEISYNLKNKMIILYIPLNILTQEHLIVITIFNFISTHAPVSTYSKPCLKRPLQKDQKIIFFKTNYRLMQVKRIAECSKGSILQYFRPSLSYHLSLRSLFCLLLSGRLRQVLLYMNYFRFVKPILTSDFQPGQW